MQKLTDEENGVAVEVVEIEVFVMFAVEQPVKKVAAVTEFV